MDGSGLGRPGQPAGPARFRDLDVPATRDGRVDTPRSCLYIFLLLCRRILAPLVAVIGAVPSCTCRLVTPTVELSRDAPSHHRTCREHTIDDEWRGRILTVWLVPSGAGCTFDMPRAWYTTDTGDRYKYVLRNRSDKTCTTRVKIVATPPLFEAGVTETLQPGQTSRPFVLHDSRDHLEWLAGIRTTTVGCTLELARVWYERKPGQSRSFSFTIRNRGSVACSGRVPVAHIENTTLIATKKPAAIQSTTTRNILVLLSRPWFWATARRAGTPAGSVPIPRKLVPTCSGRSRIRSSGPVGRWRRVPRNVKSRRTRPCWPDRRPIPVVMDRAGLRSDEVAVGRWRTATLACARGGRGWITAVSDGRTRPAAWRGQR